MRKILARWLLDPHSLWVEVVLVLFLMSAVVFVQLTLQLPPPKNAKAWIEVVGGVVTILGVVGVLLAALSYRSSERRADSLRVHQLFQDYLRMRFDVSLAERSVPPSGSMAPTTDAMLGELADTLPGQLAGSKLYALEEMLARVKRYGDKKPDVPWTAYAHTEYGPWIATLLTHLGQHQEAVTESLWVYRECYTIDLIELAAGYLGDTRLRDLADAEKQREVTGRRTPPPLVEARARKGEFAALPRPEALA